MSLGSLYFNLGTQSVTITECVFVQELPKPDPMAVDAGEGWGHWWLGWGQLEAAEGAVAAGTGV